MLPVDAFHWLTDGEHWQGAEGVPTLVWQTFTISLVSLSAAAFVAIPSGLWLGHVRRAGNAVTTVANAARAIPVYGLLVLFVLWIGIADPPALVRGIGINSVAVFLVLFILAIPPILLNSVTGVREVDAEVREAARGMGMTGGAVLRRVETPIAMPMVFAGIRTSAINVIATATLAAFVGAGGLGRIIVDGRAVRDFPKVLAGAFLVALLAVATELFFAVVERRCVSRGLRR